MTTRTAAAAPSAPAEGAYAPPAGEGAEGTAGLGRRQGAAALVCTPLAVVVIAATIGVTRATQSTGAGVVGFTTAALVAFAGAAFGISSLLKMTLAGGRGRAYSGAVFFATLLNGLLVLAGGLFAYAVLVVSD